MEGIASGAACSALLRRRPLPTPTFPLIWHKCVSN